MKSKRSKLEKEKRLTKETGKEMEVLKVRLKKKEH
ncbi:MAG: hypothetical protein BAJALOKI2v1_740011 [Promethearchaeota archaeon]|nr:MAG: hypothetical protein BAJALOKI2v1_740011 [Candidatus Lokiarchaeota archaeon]